MAVEITQSVDSVTTRAGDRSELETPVMVGAGMTHLFGIQRRLANIIVVLCLPIACLYLLVGFNQASFGFIYDEGLAVYGAARVLSGDIPYRDFWTMYAPAQFYILAGLFKLCGVSLLAARLWSTVIDALLAVVIYATARTFLPLRFAFMAWVLSVIWIGSFRFFANPLPSALLFTFLSAYCLCNFFARPGNTWLMLSGMLAAGATLFRHDIGLYTFTSELAVIVAVAFVTYDRTDLGRFFRLSKILERGAAYLSGLALVLVPVLIYLVSVVPVAELVYDLITFPLTVFPDVRHLPYPKPVPNPLNLVLGIWSLRHYLEVALERLPFYFPLLVYGAVIVKIAVQLRKKSFSLRHSQTGAVVFLLLLGLLCFNQARVRSDSSHLLPTFLPAIILFAALTSDIPNLTRFRSGVWVLALLLGVSISLNPFREKTKLVTTTFFPPPAFLFDLDRAKMIAHPHRDTYQQAIEYIQRHVPDGEEIFVGNARHDQIFINDVMFYFLADRHSATKYHELHPGLVTTPIIQDKIVSELEQKQVKTIVLYHGHYQPEPNESSHSSSITRLDDFIRAKFRPVKRFGDYTIWMRPAGSSS